MNEHVENQVPYFLSPAAIHAWDRSKCHEEIHIEEMFIQRGPGPLNQTSAFVRHHPETRNHEVQNRPYPESDSCIKSTGNTSL